VPATVFRPLVSASDGSTTRTVGDPNGHWRDWPQQLHSGYAAPQVQCPIGALGVRGDTVREDFADRVRDADTVRLPVAGLVLHSYGTHAHINHVSQPSGEQKGTKKGVRDQA